MADIVVAAVLVECKLPAAGKSLLGGVGAVVLISPRGRGFGGFGGEYILKQELVFNASEQ